MATGNVDWQNLYRPATEGWPSSPAEWDLRPYFMNDYDISWKDLRGYLESPRLGERAWATAKVLDGARWTDIWRLVTPDDVRSVLDRLPRQLRVTWTDALDAWS